MVAAAGGAPAVSTRTPGRAVARADAGALASAISTVGAAQSIVTASPAMRSKIATGSIFGRQTWQPPAAVTVQTNVQPLAWNIGSVQRYRSATVIGTCTRMPTEFIQ